MFRSGAIAAAAVLMTLVGATPAVAATTPTVRIALGASSIYEDMITTVHGSVSPVAPHHVIFLQSLGSGGWKSISQTALDSSSDYSFNVQPGAVETLTLRVYDPPTASGVTATVSATVQLRALEANQDNFTDKLPTGHVLVATSSTNTELDSAKHRMQLSLIPSQMTLSNDVEIDNVGNGYELQIHQTADQNTGFSTLTMQTDGNLVWRDDHGRVAFASNTAGTGSHNYAQLLDSGELVVRTSTGHTVWTSGTTNVLMIAGDELLSGQYLVNRTYPGQTTYLQMRSSGDLVLLENSRQVWHTATSVAGSHLTVTSTGRIAVVTPAGHLAWQSPSVGSPSLFRVAASGRIVLMSDPYGDGCWEIPAHDLTCYDG